MLEADLLRRVGDRAADPQRRTDSPFPMLGRPPGALPRPITAGGLTAAEARLGFPVPADLAQLYREIADGGFGPGDGIAPLDAAAERYLEWRSHPPNAGGYPWPARLLPFNLTPPGADCYDLEAGSIVTWDEEALADGDDESVWRRSFGVFAGDLAAWLEAWLDRPPLYESGGIGEPEPFVLDAAARDSLRESLRQAVAYWGERTPQERAEYGMPARG